MTFRSPSRWARIAAVGVAVAALFTAPAQASSDDEKITWRETGISYAEEHSPWLAWCLGSLFAVLCIAMAFKNPHRTHLD